VGRQSQKGLAGTEKTDAGGEEDDSLHIPIFFCLREE